MLQVRLVEGKDLGSGKGKGLRCGLHEQRKQPGISIVLEQVIERHLPGGKRCFSTLHIHTNFIDV